MPLVGVDHVGHRLAVGPHGLHDLVRLGDVDPRIVRPLTDDQRRPDLVRVKQRRDLPVQLFVPLGISDPQDQLLLEGGPVGGYRLKEGLDVAGPDDVDAAGIEIGGEGEARQRRVPAVRAAGNRHLLRIGDPLSDSPARGVGQVMLHGADAPLLVTGVEERLAEAGGAPKVRLQYRVTAIGEPLGPRVVAPGVSRPGTAMRVQNHGQSLGLQAHRQRQIGDHLHAVARLDHQRFPFCESILFELRSVDEQLGQLPRFSIVGVIGKGPVVDLVIDDPDLVGMVPSGNSEVSAKGRVEHLEVLLHLGVEYLPLGLQVVELDRLDPMADGVDLDPAHIAAVIVRQLFQHLAAVRVDPQQSRRVRVERGLDVDRLAVGREVQSVAVLLERPVHHLRPGMLRAWLLRTLRVWLPSSLLLANAPRIRNCGSVSQPSTSPGFSVSKAIAPLRRSTRYMSKRLRSFRFRLTSTSSG